MPTGLQGRAARWVQQEDLRPAAALHLSTLFAWLVQQTGRMITGYQTATTATLDCGAILIE